MLQQQGQKAALSVNIATCDDVMTTDGYALNEIVLEMNNAGRFGWSGSCSYRK